MTQKEIAAESGVTHSAVGYWMKKHDINRRSKGRRANGILHIPYETRIQQIKKRRPALADLIIDIQEEAYGQPERQDQAS